MRLLTALAATAAVLALAACGGDDGDGKDSSAASEEPGASAPQPRQSIRAASDKLTAAIESGDCRALFDASQHSTKREPKLSLSKAPPSKEECATLGTYGREYRGLRADGGTQVFETAAIVDGHVGRATIATAFVLDLDGSWKVSVSSGSDPQVGTKPAPDNEFDANVAKFVEAARSGDCREVYRLLSFDSTPARSGTAERFCKDIRASDPRSFFTRVEKDLDAKPTPLGKTAELAFYGLAVKPGIYYTLVALRQPDRFPVTSAHARDAVYNWYLAKE